MPDVLLALYLLLYIPARQLWKSTRKNKTGAKKSRLHSYRKTIVESAALLLVLVSVCFWSGHTPAALGLDMPLSSVGRWCLLFAVLLLGAMAASGPLLDRKLSDEKRAVAMAKVRSEDMLPRTRTELWTFVLFSLMLGTGWEVLYRGFLMLVLAPVTGVVGAVVLSALAYGAAHGYSSPKQMSLSIAAAFVFTIAFALTHSLWWLMLIHAGLPLLGAISTFKILSAPEPSIPAT